MEDNSEMSIDASPKLEREDDNVKRPVDIHKSDPETVANTLLSDLGEPIDDFQCYHWKVPSWKQLGRREVGPEFKAGNHLWRILLFPSGNNTNDIVSLYLELCGPKHLLENDWHVCAQFLLVISNPYDGTLYIHHQAHHRFVPEESDWGFTRFFECKRLNVACEGRTRPLVEDDSTVISAFVRVVQDVTGVLWHSFNNYDSKRETGYVGLKNQGATCYMNSLLQSLFCTNYFRKAVYQIPTEKDHPDKSVALALQRVFYQLQTSQEPVDTNELTKSFGWDSFESFMQHDVQEFNRVLQDNLEGKMKNTVAEGAIERLFVGKMKSYIKCINVDYESSRVENFYDIQLNVKGCQDLRESFVDYCSVETLDGDNKYYAEGFGLQDAKKGVVFESFPPVLHLQLKRFEYDFERDAMVKINDRHEFPPEIDLEEFLSEDADKSERHAYVLHGVLVHSGDLHGGHYFALIKPERDGKWLKFDDDRVVPVTEKEVFDENYGSDDSPLPPGRRTNLRLLRRFTNAYMLVYIRKSRIDEVLAPFKSEDIPQHLVERIEEEKALQARQQREREEMHLYILLKILADQTIRHHQGFDLANFDEKSPSSSGIPTTKRRKDEKFGDFMQFLSDTYNVPVGRIRIWTLVTRQNRTVRPDKPVDARLDERLERVKEMNAVRSLEWRIYVEILDPEFDGSAFPVATPNVSYMVFLKYFDPFSQQMEIRGKMYVPSNSPIGAMVPMFNRKLGLPTDTKLVMYEEIKPGMIDRLDDNVSFKQAEIQDGDIVAVQKVLPPETSANALPAGSITTIPSHYEHMMNRVLVSFKPKDTENQDALPEFELLLSKKMTYDAVAHKVAMEVPNAEPMKLRFTTAIFPRDSQRALIARNPKLTLQEMLQPGHVGQQNQTLFYEKLSIDITELETKKYMKFVLLGLEDHEEEEYEILVPKQGVVTELFSQLREKINLPEDAALKLYEVMNHKIRKEHHENAAIGDIADYLTLCVQVVYPLEEDAGGAGKPAKAVQVFHFSKEVHNPHSFPFKCFVKTGETFAETKKRVILSHCIKEREAAKAKYALVSVAPQPEVLRYLNDEDIISEIVGDQEFVIGLNHHDPSGRGYRIGEKAIKIFN